MKRLVSVLLALLMLLSLSAFAEAAGLAGGWYLQEMVLNGTPVKAANLGTDMRLTLNMDGTVLSETTYTTTRETETMQGVWSAAGDAGRMTMDGKEYALVLRGEELMIGDGETEMRFGRQPAAADVIPEAVAAGSLDDFQGVWRMTAIGAMGAVVPVSIGGQEGTMTIEGNTATSWTNSEDAGEETVTYACTLRDGRLELGNQETEAEKMTFSLLADGTAVQEIRIGDYVLAAIYFARAEMP